MKTIVNKFVTLLVMILVLLSVFIQKAEAQGAVSIDRNTFTYESAMAAWSYVQSLDGVATITANSVTGSNSGSTLQNSVVYGSPSLWYYSITFQNGNVSIDAKSGFIDYRGNPNPRFDWSYSSSTGDLSPVTSLVIGSIYKNAGASQSTTVSDIRINNIQLSDNINSSSANQFEGLRITNGDVPIVSLTYTMEIDISEADAFNLVGASLPSAVFIPAIEVVPEPSTWALIITAVLFTIIFRTKQHKSSKI